MDVSRVVRTQVTSDDLTPNAELVQGAHREPFVGIS
jgi:hypothetical protein